MKRISVLFSLAGAVIWISPPFGTLAGAESPRELPTVPNFPPAIKAPTNPEPLPSTEPSPISSSVRSVPRVSQLPQLLAPSSVLPTAPLHVGRDEQYSGGAPRDPQNNSQASSLAAIAPPELWGVWAAVRVDNGALCTVEFELSERGWARITKPRSTGTASTSRHRLELSGQALTLFAAGKQTLTGKLIDVSRRQLVLETESRTITFVRRQPLTH